MYGGGAGRIWLDEVYCSGSESSIGECKHREWGSHDCGHSEDVSINCGSNGEDISINNPH